MYPLYFNKPKVKKEELSGYGGKIQQGIGGYLLGCSEGTYMHNGWGGILKLLAGSKKTQKCLLCLKSGMRIMVKL